MRARGRHGAALARLAARRAAELTAASRRAGPPSPGRRLLRGLLAGPRALGRATKELARRNADVALFDVAFGSVKAFGVYPALYGMGLAWTIPAMEYAPLNTQLWTALYLVARGRIRSEWGRRRYGRPLHRLEALRDRRIGIGTPGARVHRVGHDGRGARVVRVRPGGLRAFWERWRGRPGPGELHPRELRRLVRDPEFRFRAGTLRPNPAFYEAVLIERLLATPHEREALLACAVSEPRLDAEGRALRERLGEGPEPARALVRARADELADRFRAARDAGLPLRVRLALRALHAAYARRVEREARALEKAEYALLAELARGSPRSSSAEDALEGARAGLAHWVQRAGELAEAIPERLEACRSREDFRRVLEVAIAEARRLGLAARRARLLARLGPRGTGTRREVPRRSARAAIAWNGPSPRRAA